MVSAGLVGEVLKNLGLGEGSALPVGVPVPWMSATPPTGWIKCNGASFSATAYPQLAKAYPSLVLPDLRGEFIRGWDDGRGIDAGRALLAMQGYAFEDHALTLPSTQGYANIGSSFNLENDIYAAFNDAMAFVGSTNSSGGWIDGSQQKIYLRGDSQPIANNKEFASGQSAPYASLRTYKASSGWNNPTINVPQTAKETRPRNIAFNYIVRAE